MSPAADGTNDTEPGTVLLPLPGSSLYAILWTAGMIGGSVEQSTLQRFMPRALSSFRIVRASGSVSVLYISVI